MPEPPDKYAHHITIADNGCWLWTGRKTSGRFTYGMINSHMAHRLIYAELIGPVPHGLELDHLCRTPLCVNPAHLEPVTHKENQRRAYALLTHCANGHPYPENAALDNRGRRYCKACNRARARRSRLRNF